MFSSALLIWWYQRTHPHTFSISSWSFPVNPLAESSLSRNPVHFAIEEKHGLSYSSVSPSISSVCSWKDRLNLEGGNRWRDYEKKKILLKIKNQPTQIGETSWETQTRLENNVMKKISWLQWYTNEINVCSS